jgi:hypothetical protein
MWDMKMKALFLGLGVATVIGISAGQSMKPALSDFEGGAQMLAPASGHRVQRIIDGAASWTSYGNQIPDYVIGTDWILPDMAATEYAEPPPQPPEPKAEPQPIARTEVASREEPQPPTRYPSEGGDILAGMDSYAPPTPPENTAPSPPPVE